MAGAEAQLTMDALRLTLCKDLSLAEGGDCIELVTDWVEVPAAYSQGILMIENDMPTEEDNRLVMCT